MTLGRRACHDTAMTKPTDPIASPALLDAIDALNRLRARQNDRGSGSAATGQVREVAVPGSGGVIVPGRDDTDEGGASVVASGQDKE